MKTKVFNKKLSLNKSTISNLGKDFMNKINGGLTETANCSQTGYICPETYEYLCNWYTIDWGNCVTRDKETAID